MIPETPQVIKSPFAYNGDIRNIPQSTPLGSNQFSFESGFPVLTQTPLNAGGLPPERIDFNSAFYVLSTFIYYMQSGNHFIWNNQLDYNIGAVVIGSDNALYYCIQANGATEPNTIQDPISSNDYWLKIINNNGKINADNLSVILGKFAQLNQLDLSNESLTVNSLPINKGGTGAETSQEAINNLLTEVQNLPRELVDDDWIPVIIGTQICQIPVTKIKKYCSNDNLPIGFIYIQLRGQSTPDELFGSSGKWQDISATYAGEFFRAVGGNSGSFGTTQAEGLPNITGNLGRTADDNLNQTNGAFFQTMTTSGVLNSAIQGSIYSYVTEFNASRSSSIYGASTHVTPYNSSIRIWKKIA